MPQRTLADLARTVPAPEARRARRAAEKLGLPLGENGSAAKTESDLEDEFLSICREYRIPIPDCQVEIGNHRVDFFWPEAMLVIETDGYVYHRGRQAMRDDNERDIQLELLGLRVVRVDDSRLEGDRAGVARDVLAMLSQRRPEPSP